MKKEIKNNIVIYQADNGKIELQADIEKDTIWATQAQIAQLFDTTTQNITVHLRKVYSDKELDKDATCKENLQVQKEGGRVVKRQVEFHNLDAIIAVGYRVNSKKATQFRIWATGIIRNYLVEGHVLNKYRLEGTPEKLAGLYSAIAFLESKNFSGKLRGKITLKLTEELEPNGK